MIPSHGLGTVWKRKSHFRNMEGRRKEDVYNKKRLKKMHKSKQQ